MKAVAAAAPPGRARMPQLHEVSGYSEPAEALSLVLGNRTQNTSVKFKQTWMSRLVHGW
jgi:hypothetical protein